MSEPQSPFQELERQFMAAVRARNAGEVDQALDLFETILAQEPRMAEVHIELAHIGIDTGRLEDAEGHARRALELLAGSGLWLETFELTTVTSVAHSLLAEALRRRADEDDIIFGDPATFMALVKEAKQHFDRAAELDPGDATSSYYAFYLGNPDRELPV